MTNKPTDIRAARVLREMGVPLTTPVVDLGELPASVEKAMKAGFGAAVKFRDRVYAFAEKQTDKTARAMMRSFDRFVEATEPPSGDSFEDRLTASLLQSEFQEIRDQWTPIFEDLNDGSGESVTIDLRRLWPFKETEATKRRQAHPEM